MNYTTLNDFLRHIERSEHFFRMGMKASASEALLPIIEHLAIILPRCTATESQILNTILREIILSQENSDMIRTADLLYYELSDFMVSTLNSQIFPYTSADN